MSLIVNLPRNRLSDKKPHRIMDNRRVTFSDQRTVFFVADLGTEHKSDLWFTNEEICSFERNASLFARIVRRVMRMSMAEYAENHAEDTEAFLGLERFLNERTPGIVIERRRALLVAVAGEQLRQRRLGICDQEAMARVSGAESAMCRRRARMIGLLHANKR